MKRGFALIVPGRKVRPGLGEQGNTFAGVIPGPPAGQKKMDRRSPLFVTQIGICPGIEQRPGMRGDEALALATAEQLV